MLMYVMYTPPLICRTPCLRKNSLRQSLNHSRDNANYAFSRKLSTRSLRCLRFTFYCCIEVKELYVAEHALKITTYQIEQILEKICSRLTSTSQIVKEQIKTVSSS